MKKSPRKPAGTRSTNKRAKILRCAEREFAGRGFAGARMERIARAAGLDKATLYHYFRTKQELYRSVLLEVTRAFNDLSTQGFDHDTDPGEELTEFIGSLMDFFNRHRSFVRLIRREIEEPAQGSRAVLQEAFTPLVRRVRAYIRENVEGGEMREVDVDHAIFSLYEILFSYFALHLGMAGMFFDEPPFTPAMLQRRKSHVAEVIRRLLVPDEVAGEPGETGIPQ